MANPGMRSDDVDWMLPAAAPLIKSAAEARAAMIQRGVDNHDTRADSAIPNKAARIISSAAEAHRLMLQRGQR